MRAVRQRGGADRGAIGPGGAALVMPLAMATLSGAFAKEERAWALGIFSGITGCALIIGPAVGGFITETPGWRWTFWINLPIGMIAIALVLARLRESFGPQAALDVPGWCSSLSPHSRGRGRHPLSICWVVSVDFDGSWQFSQSINTPGPITVQA